MWLCYHSRNGCRFPSTFFTAGLMRVENGLNVPSNFNLLWEEHYCSFKPTYITLAQAALKASSSAGFTGVTPKTRISLSREKDPTILRRLSTQTFKGALEQSQGQHPFSPAAIKMAWIGRLMCLRLMDHLHQAESVKEFQNCILLLTHWWI